MFLAQRIEEVSLIDNDRDVSMAPCHIPVVRARFQPLYRADCWDLWSSDHMLCNIMWTR